MNEYTTSNTVNYCMAVEAVQTVVNQLCQKLQHGNLNHSNDGAPIWTFSNDQTTVTFNQPDLLSNDGFFNMNTTLYSLAQAFPTVFIPTFIHYQCTWQWVILYGVTGSIGTRERIFYMNTWYEYTIWRSDGISSSHPTFSLVIYNHKLKPVLRIRANL